MSSYDEIMEHAQYITNLTSDVRSSVSHVSQDICYICGSSSSSHVGSIHSYDYVQCNNCGHAYTSLRPSAESLANFYATNDYWSKTTYANKNTYKSRLEQIARPKFEFAVKDLSPSPNSRRWLDVGCGIGDLLYIAREEGFDVCGLELSNASREFALEEFNLNLLPYEISEYVSSSTSISSFSVISLIGLLEHVPNPVDTLKACVGLLNDDGLLMIQVPNWDSLTTKLQLVNPEYVYRHASPLEHIQLFTLKSVKHLLSLFDLEIASIWWHGLDIHQLQVQYTLLSPDFAASDANKTFTSMFNNLQQTVDSMRQSDRILLTARKA